MVRSLKTLSRIVIKLITNDEIRDDNNNRRETPTVKWELLRRNDLNIVFAT